MTGWFFHRFLTPVNTYSNETFDFSNKILAKLQSQFLPQPTPSRGVLKRWRFQKWVVKPRLINIIFRANKKEDPCISKIEWVTTIFVGQGTTKSRNLKSIQSEFLRYGHDFVHVIIPLKVSKWFLETWFLRCSLIYFHLAENFKHPLNKIKPKLILLLITSKYPYQTRK